MTKQTSIKENNTYNTNIKKKLYTNRTQEERVTKMRNKSSYHSNVRKSSHHKNNNTLTEHKIIKTRDGRDMEKRSSNTHVISHCNTGLPDLVPPVY